MKKIIIATLISLFSLTTYNIYSQIVNKEVKQKSTLESFSIFQQKYVEEQISKWQQKGEFEKTVDWQIRVNEEKRKQKIETIKEDAINAYAENLHIRLGFCYIGASLQLGKYDADKELYTIKSRDFEDIIVPVPINEAEEFKYKNWCGDSDPTNVIYFILNDKLALAKATFWEKYTYENPLARERLSNLKINSNNNPSLGNSSLNKIGNNYGGEKGLNNNQPISGRKILFKPQVKSKCNNEGTIVIQVSVNRIGTVTDAKLNAQGSNTTSKCLIDAAIQSSLKYKWNEDENAPEEQIGYIVYNFRNG